MSARSAIVHTFRVCATAALFFLAPGVRAEEPKPGPKPEPKTQSVGQVTDWGPYVRDIQDSDKAKQDAAAAVFFESGQLGYNILGALLKSPDAALVKRVKELRQKIDERSYKMFGEAEQMRERAFSKPLTPEVLDSLKSKWSEVAAYATVMQVKQQSFQILSEIKRTIANVDAANKKLAEIDGDLKADPAPQGLYRASLLINRAEALKLMLRDKDVVTAAQEAAVASGPQGRLTPAALRVQVEAYQRLNDFVSLHTACRRILSDFPRSLETHFARQALLEALIRQKRYDDAIKELKDAYTAFPVDEEVQQSISSLLAALMDQEHDYKRVAELSEWAITALPMERIEVDIPKCFGGCNEYVTKDFTKAERGYAMLHDFFPDIMDPKDVEKVQERLKLKAAGKFPKEPAEADDGPAGALAGFLRAVRTRDAKALEQFAPEEQVDEFKQELDEPGDTFVPLLTFADVIVRNVEYSPQKESATLFLDIYPSAGLVAKAALQFASKEGGKWKIRWRNLPEATGEMPTFAPQEAPNTPNANPPEKKPDAPKAPEKPQDAPPTPQAPPKAENK